MQSDAQLSTASLNDKADWDAYSLTHESTTAYHKYAWLEAVEHAYGHKPLGVIARHPKTQKVVGLFPAVFMKTPFWGKQICALPYCDVGYGIADNAEVLQDMQHFLHTKMANAGCRKLEIRQAESTPPGQDIQAGHKVRMLLSLPESSDTLMASFKSKLRSQIRKAEKNGLTVTLGKTPELLKHFYRVYAVNMRDLGSPVHALGWFESVLAAYNENCIVSVVYKGDMPVGAGLVIINGNKASIPWASTLREFNKLAPNMLLYWSLLAHCADSGIDTFDFGRYSFEEGTYKFKKQWGAVPQPLNWQSLGADNKKLGSDTSPSTSKFRPLMESIWRKLPLEFTIKAGAYVRPYISL